MNLNDYSPYSTSRKRSLLWSPTSLNCLLETLGEDEANEMDFSSIGEEDGFIYPWLRAQMTLLSSLLQWNYHHAIRQFKRQKCPSTSKKQDITNNVTSENVDLEVCLPTVLESLNQSRSKKLIADLYCCACEHSYDYKNWTRDRNLLRFHPYLLLFSIYVSIKIHITRFDFQHCLNQWNRRGKVKLMTDSL